MIDLDDIIQPAHQWKVIDGDDYDEIGSFPDDKLMIEFANGVTHYFVREHDDEDE